MNRPVLVLATVGLLAMLGSAGADERRAAVEDLFWALMTSREFLFQH